MAQVPQSQRPGLMRLLGNGSHIIHEGTLKGHVREGNQRGFVINRCGNSLWSNGDGIGRGDKLQPVPLTEQVNNALQNVQV